MINQEKKQKKKQTNHKTLSCQWESNAKKEEFNEWEMLNEKTWELFLLSFVPRKVIAFIGQIELWERSLPFSALWGFIIIMHDHQHSSQLDFQGDFPEFFEKFVSWFFISLVGSKIINFYLLFTCAVFKRAESISPVTFSI